MLLTVAFWAAALSSLASASPVVYPRQATTTYSANSAALSLASRYSSITNPRTSSTTALPTATGAYAIPQKASDPIVRAAGITLKQLTFLYGPAVAGGPYFPAGLLGTTKVAVDLLALQADATPQLIGTVADDTAAVLGLAQYDGLKTVEDYTKLYDNEWTNTLPAGPAPGVLTNYTDDLFFSMERLSTSPYQVKRLDPSSDSLAFQVDDSTAQNITGATLQQLFEDGRLFYADYRDQADLTPTSRYSAACDAYFYINSSSDYFLPLAIRPNAGSSLIYTPADSAEDWLLAKIMYNVNDFWFAQWNHLANTHEVVQIAYMAAIRTLSEQHPVKAILDRLMYEVFSIQPLAQIVLFDDGAAVDQNFAYTGTSAQDYCTAKYETGGSGRFQANYFATELQNRGLINSTVGPELKNFPFYEDGSAIWNAIHTFMASFVDSYYSSDSVVAADSELKAWATEANGPAKAIDFPSAISSKSSLADILTHFAHLASTSHHTVNTNELLSISATLPFHPSSLYSPVPTSKGNTSVVDFLPPFDKVLEQFTIDALFARPQLAGTDRTIIHMFDDSSMLSNMNNQTEAAAATFKSSMQTFSSEVSARGFDSYGLSQGMPFVWQALDPNVAPYSITT